MNGLKMISVQRLKAVFETLGTSLSLILASLILSLSLTEQSARAIPPRDDPSYRRAQDLLDSRHTANNPTTRVTRVIHDDLFAEYIDSIEGIEKMDQNVKAEQKSLENKKEELEKLKEAMKVKKTPWYKRKNTAPLAVDVRNNPYMNRDLKKLKRDKVVFETDIKEYKKNLVSFEVPEHYAQKRYQMAKTRLEVMYGVENVDNKFQQYEQKMRQQTREQQAQHDREYYDRSVREAGREVNSASTDEERGLRLSILNDRVSRRGVVYSESLPPCPAVAHSPIQDSNQALTQQVQILSELVSKLWDRLESIDGHSGRSLRSRRRLVSPSSDSSGSGYDAEEDGSSTFPRRPSRLRSLRGSDGATSISVQPAVQGGSPTQIQVVAPEPAQEVTRRRIRDEGSSRRRSRRDSGVSTQVATGNSHSSDEAVERSAQPAVQGGSLAQTPGSVPQPSSIRNEPRRTVFRRVLSAVRLRRSGNQVAPVAGTPVVVQNPLNPLSQSSSGAVVISAQQVGQGGSLTQTPESVPQSPSNSSASLDRRMQQLPSVESRPFFLSSSMNLLEPSDQRGPSSYASLEEPHIFPSSFARPALGIPLHRAFSDPDSPLHALPQKRNEPRLMREYRDYYRPLGGSLGIEFITSPPRSRSH